MEINIEITLMPKQGIEQGTCCSRERRLNRSPTAPQIDAKSKLFEKHIFSFYSLLFILRKYCLG